MFSDFKSLSPSDEIGLLSDIRDYSPVDDIQLVQMLQCEEQFRTVETCPLLVEGVLALQVVEQFSAINEAVAKVSGSVATGSYETNVREHQVQLLLRLEAELKRYDERAVDLGKDQTFCKGMCDFISRNDMCLPDSLQRVDTPCVAFPNLHNLSHYHISHTRPQQSEIENSSPSRTTPYR